MELLKHLTDILTFLLLNMAIEELYSIQKKQKEQHLQQDDNLEMRRNQDI